MERHKGFQFSTWVHIVQSLRGEVEGLFSFSNTLQHSGVPANHKLVYSNFESKSQKVNVYSHKLSFVVWLHLDHHNVGNKCRYYSADKDLLKGTASLHIRHN